VVQVDLDSGSETPVYEADTSAEGLIVNPGFEECSATLETGADLRPNWDMAWTGNVLWDRESGTQPLALYPTAETDVSATGAENVSLRLETLCGSGECKCSAKQAVLLEEPAQAARPFRVKLRYKVPAFLPPVNTKFLAYVSVMDEIETSWADTATCTIVDTGGCEKDLVDGEASLLDCVGGEDGWISVECPHEMQPGHASVWINFRLESGEGEEYRVNIDDVQLLLD
jgi:hypothetical protein